MGCAAGVPACTTGSTVKDDATEWGADLDALPDHLRDAVTVAEDPQPVLDVGAGGEADPDSAGDGPTTVRVPPGRPRRVCKVDGCDNPLPDGAPGARRYCDEHQPDTHHKAKAAGKVKIKTPPVLSAEDALAQVERNAALVAKGVAGVMAWVAQSTSNPVLLLDAADIQGGADYWAHAVRDVAVHEEWLRRALSGGTGSERVMAWVALGGATLTMALPILLRHDKLPAGLAAQLVPSNGDRPQPDPQAEPAAA